VLLSYTGLKMHNAPRRHVLVRSYTGVGVTRSDTISQWGGAFILVDNIIIGVSLGWISCHLLWALLWAGLKRMQEEYRHITNGPKCGTQYVLIDM